MTKQNPSSGLFQVITATFGACKPEIILADDWDSDEVNAAIAQDFCDSEIDPR